MNNIEMKDECYNLLKKNNILHFYHFTNILNLNNILKSGLYSRKYIEDNKIECQFSGNELSRYYDRQHGTLNDIHLSFCQTLPMAYHVSNNGKQLILISINIDIVKDENLKIRYSDSNVASQRAIIKDNMEHIDFEAIKLPKAAREHPLFHKRQAEILIEQHIPLKYIESISLIYFNPVRIISIIDKKLISIFEYIHKNNENKIQQEKSITELKKYIPELEKFSIEEILKLKQLNLTHITTLPESIGELKNLQILFLWDCENLKTLPESIGLLSNLQKLYLTGCYNLTTLPESIGQLQNLQSLDLSGCENIKTLPESIGQLQKLQKLDLRFHKFKTIPDCIGQLKNLQVLDLRNCPNLETIPENIKQLNLEIIDLRGCEKLSMEKIFQFQRLNDELYGIYGMHVLTYLL